MSFQSPNLPEHTPAPKWLPQWGLQLSERRVLLFLGDFITAALALLAAFYLWTLTSGDDFTFEFIRTRPWWLAILVPVWMLLSPNFYNLRLANSLPRTLQAMLLSSTLASGVYFFGYFFAPPGLLPRLVVLYFMLVAFVLTLGWRALYILIFTRRGFRRRILVVGAGWAGLTLLKTLKELDDQYDVVGLIDDNPTKHNTTLVDIPVLGGSDQLATIVTENRIPEVVLAITGSLSGQMFQALLDCHEAGTDITRMPTIYEALTGRVPIEHLDSDWLLTNFAENVQLNSIGRLGHRVLDVIGALVGLLILLLLLPGIALAVWLEDRGPLVYRQQRVGRGGRVFSVLKFRTMTVDAEADGRAQWASNDDPRITRVGRFLRRARLDEWPQFWNVLRGEMSLVGPRPERPEFVRELEHTIPFYRSRLLVKPGITGWAQVNFPYGASVEDSAVKLQYDLYYIKNRSLWLNLSILLRTIAVVLQLKGK